MKKVILLLVMVVCGVLTSNAQIVGDHAIGLRLGGGDGFGTEISYQHTLTDSNRLQADLGFRNNDHWNSWAVTGIYQWVWNIEGGFNWYAGGGAGIGGWNHKDSYVGNDSDGFVLTVNGVVGIEYVFPEIPLQLAIDTQPEVGLINDYGFNMDLALSVRYVF